MQALSYSRPLLLAHLLSTPGELMPNARPEPRLEAEAQRKLEGVGSRPLLAAGLWPWHLTRFGFYRLGDTQDLSYLLKTCFVCVGRDLAFQMFEAYFLPRRGRMMVLPNKGIGQGIKLWGACTC